MGAYKWKGNGDKKWDNWYGNKCDEHDNKYISVALCP